MRSNLPLEVKLLGPSREVFQQAAHLATLGYTFGEWQQDQALPNVGQFVLFMTLKDIDLDMIEAAEQAIASAKAVA